VPSQGIIRSLLAWGAILPLILLVYFPVFAAPFLLDDHSGIVNNSDIRSLSPTNLLAMVKGHRDVRAIDHHPVSALAFLLDYQLAGLDPAAYHLGNLLYLWLASGAALWVAQLAGLPLTPSALLAALWVLHPLASMQAGYIMSRQESLLVTFYLLAIGLVLRGRHWWAIPAGVLAFLSKEVAVSLPVSLLLVDWAWHGPATPWATLRRRWRFYLVLTLVWGALCAYHLLGGRRHEIGASGMPLADPLAYFLTQTQVWLQYLRVLFWPARLEFYPYLRPAADPSAWLPGLGLALAYLSIASWLLWRRRQLAVVLLLPVCVLAVTSSFIPIPFEPAMEYRMFLPSLFLMGLLLFFWWRKISLPWLRWALPVVLIIALGARSHLRARDYTTAIRLYEADLTHNPRNLNALDALSGLYRDAQLADRATATAWRLVDLSLEEGNREYTARGFVFLGLLEYDRKNFVEAKDFFGRAIAINGNWNARLNLAIIHVELYELEAAEKLLDQYLQRSPDHPSALMLLYEAKMSARKPFEAEPVLDRLLRLYPERQELAAQRQRLERMKRQP
jgi:tetratricopeptide (TPR) repeat protein